MVDRVNYLLERTPLGVAEAERLVSLSGAQSEQEWLALERMACMGMTVDVMLAAKDSLAAFPHDP